MKHKKRNLIIALLVLLVGFIAWWYLMKNIDTETEVTTAVYVVKKLPAEAAERCVVRARGILTCADTVPVMTGIRGRIIELLPQGTHVKKGDKLFQQDDTEAREDIENQENNLQTNTLSLVKLEAQYQLADFQESQEIALSTARLKHAELEERLELEEPDARDRRLLDIEEELAKLDLEDAEDEYEREKRMFGKGYIAESALEPYEQRLENARTSLEETKLSNELTKKGATEERRVELRMNVMRLEHRKARAEAHKKRRMADIQAGKEAEEYQMKVSKHTLAFREGELKKAAVFAPMDGVFMVETYRDWSVGGALREVAIGDDKYPNDVMGQVINPERMEVRFVVNEADFHRLSVGMAVEVQMPAVPGRTFKGKLKRLGAIGRDRNRIDPTSILSGDSEISMFNAVIDLDSEGAVFHPGMSALVSIVVDGGSEERLLLPRAAVSKNGDGHFCVTMHKDGGAREVTGRYYNEQYFLVESGLSEGDELDVSIYRGVF